MAKLSVYNIEGNQVGEIELNDAVFGVEVNENLMHKAVVAQLAASRQGTQSAKTRSEVSGGGRKPWRQKGTGHARQGSTRSPVPPLPRPSMVTLRQRVGPLGLPPPRRWTRSPRSPSTKLIRPLLRLTAWVTL